MARVSKSTLKTLNKRALRLDYANQKVLVGNLLEARKQLKKNLTPEKLQTNLYLPVINSVIQELTESNINNFPIEQNLEHGLRDGVIIAEETLNAGSEFLQWTPILPINAISYESDEFATLITKASDDLKKQILRSIQVNIAQGNGTQAMLDSILGTGLQGSVGKDGVFRSAHYRAEMQARTIATNLLNRGALETYNQVNTTVPEAGLKKAWATVSDHRTSERCESLNGQVVELDSIFIAKDGWTGYHPAAHPNCRSRVIMIAERYLKQWNQRFLAA